MSYETIDTLVVTNAGKTDTVRVSATVNNNGTPAIQWVFRDGRITNFSNDSSVCRSVNRHIAYLLDDQTIIDELDLFTNKHTTP
jgi:hypothetical protein